MSSRYVTKNGLTMKRGVFSNGIWHCDCDPRMPADKFQTKNGGKNHGRWFYTCQKPTPKRCSFFLWEDEAKVREEGAVLSNSRSEPTETSRTPKKIGTPAKQTKLTAQLPTPSTKSKSPPKLEAIAPPSSTAGNFDDWLSDGDDADLASALDEFETPRKAARNHYDDSPTKKRTVSDRSYASSTTLPLHDDPAEIFSTPLTSKKPIAAPFNRPNTPTIVPHLPTPTPDPSSISADPGPLALSALSILSTTTLTPTQTAELTQLLNTHELRTTGISKGRDIARLGLQAKDHKINELETRIKGLEMEKETMRSVVGCLKDDIANSPKRPRRPTGHEGDDDVGGGGYQQRKSGYSRPDRGRSGLSRGEYRGRGSRSVV